MTDLTKLAEALDAIATNYLYHEEKQPIREAASILRAAAGADVQPILEIAAEAIYNQWSKQDGFVPWVPGGNSHKQTEARHIARTALESALRLALQAGKDSESLTNRPSKEWYSKAIMATLDDDFIIGPTTSTAVRARIPKDTTPCTCAACMPQGTPLAGMRMILCPICGNKRCPHATDHRNPCTNSNAPGQPGSSYPPQPKGQP